jgi:hypothetical protein
MRERNRNDSQVVQARRGEMSSYEELCERYGELIERVEDCDQRATDILLKVVEEFRERIGAPESFEDPVTNEKHPYVAAYKDNDKAGSKERYARVGHTRIDLPQDVHGKYEGYVGLMLSHAPDGLPKRGHLVKCRIKVKQGSVDFTVADAPAINIKDGDSFAQVSAALVDFYTRLLSFDPARDDPAQQSAIGFVDYGEPG